MKLSDKEKLQAELIEIVHRELETLFERKFSGDKYKKLRGLMAREAVDLADVPYGTNEQKQGHLVQFCSDLYSVARRPVYVEPLSALERLYIEDNGTEATLKHKLETLLWCKAKAAIECYSKFEDKRLSFSEQPFLATRVEAYIDGTLLKSYEAQELIRNGGEAASYYIEPLLKALERKLDEYLEDSQNMSHLNEH